jgi:ribosome-associated translation inhibitor RaiA
MKFSDQSYNLRIKLDSKQCELTPAEIQKIETAFDILRPPLAKFPVSDLNLTIEHRPRTNSYRVKAALQLPGRALATGGEGEHIFPALQQCVWRLVQKVAAYEERMEGLEEKTKREEGKRHDVIPTREVDAKAVEEAVRAGDYAAFRKLMFVYEETLRARIGRWVERYPQVEAQLGEQLGLQDIVEEVFLTAFDQYENRPQAVPLGEWLERLIDPSVKLLSTADDEELDNISFARTLVGE